MGLFINKGKHPDVYKNRGEINEHNQDYSKTDYLSELIKEQNEAYSSLNNRLHDFEDVLGKHKRTQTNQWTQVGVSLKELNERHHQHQKFEEDVIEWLKKLEEKNSELKQILENERVLEKELLTQVNIVIESNNEIVNGLEKYELVNEQLTSKMNEQLELQMQMSEQISKQDEVQIEVLSRMDKQEGLTEKVVMQIDYIRSILFERANYLVEKIEDGYSNTTSYIYNLVTGSDQKLTRFLTNQKKEENVK